MRGSEVIQEQRQSVSYIRSPQNDRFSNVNVSQANFSGINDSGFNISNLKISNVGNPNDNSFQQQPGNTSGMSYADKLEMYLK